MTVEPCASDGLKWVRDTAFVVCKWALAYVLSAGITDEELHSKNLHPTTEVVKVTALL